MKFQLFQLFFLFITKLCCQNYFNTVIPTSEYYIENIYCQSLLNQKNNLTTFVLSEFRTKSGFLNKIISINGAGDLIHINDYLDSLNSEAIFALRKLNSGILASGYKFRSSDTINHFWYAKLNNNFDTLWTKGFKMKFNNSSFNNIMELRNGSIGLCGTDMQVRRNGTFISTIPVVAIADSLGLITHYTEIRGNDTLAAEVLFGITEGLDNSIYASGYVVRSDILDQDPLIAKVNSKGGLQWRKQIDNKGYNEIFKNVITQKDGSILAVGASYSANNAPKEFSFLLFINFNKEGNINWTKRLFKGNDNDFSNAIQDNNGNIIGAGLYERNRSKNKEGHGWVFKCSPQGDSIWSRVIIHASDSFPERFQNISQASDGGFYLTGYSFLPGDYSSKAWIVKTDSFGCVVPGCEKIVSVEDIQSGKEKAFVFFPNPVVSKKLYFLSRIGSGEAYQLQIHNLQGDLVQTYPFRANVGTQYEVDIKSSVCSGMYVVSVLNKNERVVVSEKMEVF